MHFFLSQSAMLFGGYIEGQVIRIEERKTYVRIINEVDAARMARFPVSFTPNVGHILRKTKGTCAYGIEYI